MSKNLSCLITLNLFLLSLDRLTKKLVIWQNLPHQKNTNLFFFNLPHSLLIILSITTILLLVLWFKKTHHPQNHLLNLGLLLILTGGLSNLYDRLTLNYVIDWIYLPFFPFSVLNLADTYITIGAILLLINPHNS